MMRAVTALAGAVLVAVPVAADPRAAYPVAVIGLVCALVIGWPRRGAAAGRRVAAAIRARAWIPARKEIGPAGRGPAPPRPAPPGTAHASPAPPGTAHASPAPPGPAHASPAPASPGAAAEGREPGPAGPDVAEKVRAAAGTVVAVAVIVECAASRLDSAAMAGEGLLLLGFLVLLGRPAGLAGGTTRAWLRLRLPTVLAAVAATGIVLAALAAVPGSSPWLALGGLAAAVVAYLVAAPRDRSGGSPPG
jgi:hypothetical protein